MRKLLLSLASVSAISLVSHATSDDFEAWLKSERTVSVERLNANISVPGTRRGLILASPSKADPNYFYYWVRDGAMVMQSVFDRLSSGDAKAYAQFQDYIDLSRENQELASRSYFGQGEPRFNTDGSVNTEPWGRPQNDGPALRALTLIRYARERLRQGDRASVTRDLYIAEMPARSVIKIDLEYVSHHWRDRCIDLWEEAMGHHFYTRAAMMMALREGADLATEMSDPGAAYFYREQSDLIEQELAKHWDSTREYYLSSLDYEGGPDHAKPSQLDVSVLLAALFNDETRGLLNLADDRMIQTAEALEASFQKLYPINAASAHLGTAIGRYQEDVYFGGNPWVLTTAAFAEWNYRLANRLVSSAHFILTRVQAAYLKNFLNDPRLIETFDLGAAPALREQVALALREHGDSYLRRVRESVGPSGALSEQIDSKTAQMISARDLSWSYAAVLRASDARVRLNLRRLATE